MAVKTFGLALGGGGVRGLAHALVLEALDEIGCRPSVIAGPKKEGEKGSVRESWRYFQSPIVIV